MFHGFSNETIDFMWGIRFNNEKAWFEAHKQDYLTYFDAPMRALSQAVFETVVGHHSDLDLICRSSRIYRDARRLRGRGPYKDRLWFSMERPCEEWTREPVFFFELSPEGSTYGLGYYYAKPLTMAKLRARLDSNSKQMETLVRAIQKANIFTLDGEDYKRPKGETSPLLAPYYNKKGFSLIAERPHDQLLFTPQLATALAADMETLVPLYRYLITLDADPDPRL